MERKTVPADTSIVLKLHLDKAQLWQNTLKNNTTLLQTIHDQTISQLDYKRVKSRNYPYLRLSAGYGWNTGTVTAPMTETISLTYIGRSHGNSPCTMPGIVGGNKPMHGLVLKTAGYAWNRCKKCSCSSRSGQFVDGFTKTTCSYGKLKKANLNAARSNFDIAMERYRLRELSGIELWEAHWVCCSRNERLSTVEYNIKICEISLLLSGETF